MTRRIAATTALAATVALIAGETAAQGDLALPTAPSVPSTPSTPTVPSVPSVPSTSLPSPSLPAPTVPEPPPAPAPSVPKVPSTPRLPAPTTPPSTPRLPSSPVSSTPKLPSSPTLQKTAPAPSSPRLPAAPVSSPTLGSGSVQRLPTSSLPSAGGGTTALGGTASRGSGTTGGGGATGQAGYAAAGLAGGSQTAISAQYGTPVSRQAFSSILRLLDAGGQGAHARASARRLRAALAGLQGCFYGLSGVERRVIFLRTGLRGGRGHSRRYVARRLGTSRGQVRRVERRAVRKLYELVNTGGCAAGDSGQATALALDGGPIGPAELAAVPGLIAFASPAHQAARQADLAQPDFSQLGKKVDFPSPSGSIRGFNDGSDNGIVWAFQLLAVMLLVAIGGFTRAAPLIAARARRGLAALRRGYGRAPRPRPLAGVGALVARPRGRRAAASRSNGVPVRANGRAVAVNGGRERIGGTRARPNGVAVPANGGLAGVNEPDDRAHTAAPAPDRETDAAPTRDRSRPKIPV